MNSQNTRNRLKALGSRLDNGIGIGKKKTPSQIFEDALLKARQRGKINEKEVSMLQEHYSPFSRFSRR